MPCDTMCMWHPALTTISLIGELVKFCFCSWLASLHFPFNITLIQEETSLQDIPATQHHPTTCHAKIDIPKTLFYNYQSKTMINIKKQYQQTTRGLIQRLINNTLLLWIGVIVAENFCIRNCVCCSQVCPLCHVWKAISCQTEKGNKAKHRQSWQGNSVEDGYTSDIHVRHVPDWKWCIWSLFVSD